MRTAIASILLILTAVAHGETWQCKAGPLWLDSNPIVVVLTVSDDQDSGTIHVAGTIQDAYYHVQGFNRRWDFGRRDDGTYAYAFALTPGGQGLYLDFGDSDTTTASQIFTCRQED